MRITGGKLRGQSLSAPAAKVVRPSADRVREAVGSILSSRGAYEGARVLDLFAGSGAYGFEALSRGAEALIAIDKLPVAIETIRENAARLRLSVEILRVDLLTSLERAISMLEAHRPFALIFADPPYTEIANLPAILDSLAERGILQQGALLVVEGPSAERPPDFELLDPLRVYRYGDTLIALYVYEGK